MTNSRFEHLVLDTTPLLKNTIYPALSEHYYTVSAVLSELKDEESRNRVQNGSLNIQVREPSTDALKIVNDAAKKTGDIISLSKADLTLVALCVTMDMELNPGKRDFIVKEAKTVVLARPIEPKKDERVPTKDAGEGEWITPDNYESMMSSPLPVQAVNSQPVQLACVTGDCAVQNLLLSLRLKAYNADLKRVHKTKSFLLRCGACFHTLPPHTAACQFCPACGSPALARTSYSTNSSGTATVHLKPAFQPNLRGTIFSLPAPKGGRTPAMVLRADQPEYLRAVEKQKVIDRKAGLRAERGTDVIEEVDDRLAAVFGDMQFVKGKHSQQAGRAQIGYGRRNPNVARR